MSLGRPLRWPDRETLLVYFGYGLLVDVVFLTVFGGANWLAAGSGSSYRFYMDWELSIPFVPAFVWAYCSLWVLFFLPLFQLNPAELRRLALQVIAATLATGVVFVLLPADIYFERPESFTGRAWLDHLIFRYNSAPSLHVIFAGLIVLAACEVATPRLRRLYGLWFLLIAVATVLTHQHHIVDVVSALPVILAARWLLPLRRPFAIPSVHPATMEETNANQAR